jgi:hypothetical protein
VKTNIQPLSVARHDYLLDEQPKIMRASLQPLLPLHYPPRFENPFSMSQLGGIGGVLYGSSCYTTDCERFEFSKSNNRWFISSYLPEWNAWLHQQQIQLADFSCRADALKALHELLSINKLLDEQLPPLDGLDVEGF